MADSRQLDSAWIIISCSESHADDIKCLEANESHFIVYEDRPSDERDVTPFGDEQRVYFGLRPRKEPSYLFGAADNVSFQIVKAGAGRKLRVSEEHFRLDFNRHGSWMLVDLSSNGTWVDQDLVASNKARGYTLSKGMPISSQYRQIALHPEKWNLITAGKLEVQIKVGHETPSSFVSHDGELALDHLHLQSHPTSMTPSVLIQPAFANPRKSRKFHSIENGTSGSSSKMKLLVDKSTGQRVIGQTYISKTPEEDAAEDRYKALFQTLKEGRGKNLIPFLESTQDEGVYTIISEYWPSTSLSELIEEELTPSSLQLSFVFAQINQGIAYLHSKGIMHGNIRPGAILVGRGLPVTSRLTGFLGDTPAGSATEAVGDRDFRAPEMSDNQEYDQLVDVFSLSKIIQHCLTVQGITKTLIDPLLGKGLAPNHRERLAAATIQREIDLMADGDYVWPFQSLTLKRRFKVAWYHEGNDTYIRQSDLWQLVQALADSHRPTLDSAIVKIKNIDDPKFPGQYCRLVYARTLFDECGIRWHAGILHPRILGSGVFSTHVDLDFELYYHSRSQMFNVTTLLKTISLESARVATWDLHPQIQEVHGDPQWEGNYIDRESFEKVLQRVRKNEMVKLVPDLAELGHRRMPTRFSTVQYSKAVIVVTRWLTPPWVLLSRDEGGQCDAEGVFSSRADLQKWCATYGLQSVADRIDLTVRRHHIPNDWKVTPKCILPPVGQDDMTSILSTHSSSSFRFTNRRDRKRRARPDPVQAQNTSKQPSDIMQMTPEILPPLVRRGGTVVMSVRGVDIVLQIADASVDTMSLVTLAVMEHGVINVEKGMQWFKENCCASCADFLCLSNALQMCSDYRLLDRLWPLLSFGITLRARMMSCEHRHSDRERSARSACFIWDRQRHQSQEAEKESISPVLPTLTDSAPDSMAGEPPKKYLRYVIDAFEVLLDPRDMSVDIRQLALAAGHEPNQVVKIIRTRCPHVKCIPKILQSYPGIFYPVDIIIDLCDEFGFPGLSLGFCAVGVDNHRCPTLPLFGHNFMVLAQKQGRLERSTAHPPSRQFPGRDVLNIGSQGGDEEDSSSYGEWEDLDSDEGRRLRRLEDPDDDHPENVVPIGSGQLEKPEFWSLETGGKTVFIRAKDFWINASHICEAAGKGKRAMEKLKVRWKFDFERVSRLSPWDGTYVPFITGLQISQLYGLQDLAKFLRKTLPEACNQEKLPLGPKFSTVRHGENLISVRNDGYVNVAHILRIAGKGHHDVAALKRQSKQLDFQTVRGDPKVRGTYVELSEGVKICEGYQLQSVAECLRDFESRWSFGCHPNELISHSQPVIGTPNHSFIRACEALHPEIEDMVPSQPQIPSLPDLPTNNIDYLSVAERCESPRSQKNFRNHSHVDQNIQTLLSPSMSQRSRLSQIQPSFGLETLSSHYSLDD